MILCSTEKAPDMYMSCINHLQRTDNDFSIDMNALWEMSKQSRRAAMRRNLPLLKELCHKLCPLFYIVFLQNIRNIRFDRRQ